MRISLTETQEIERYLQNRMSLQENLVMDAKMQIDPDLPEKIKAQRKAYELISLFGRDRLRKEIAKADQKLFADSRFRKFQHKVISIFQ